jgi:hypothetical protein
MKGEREMIIVKEYIVEGNPKIYKYEGDSEYNGKPETARERAERHFKKCKHKYEILGS